MLDTRPISLPQPLATRGDRVVTDALQPVRTLLLGGSTPPTELPALAEIVAAALALAGGTRRKMILPVAGEPAEFALVRHGSQLRVSHYATGLVPEIHFLDREVSLDALITGCRRAAEQLVRISRGTEQEAWRRMSQRLVGVTATSPDAAALELVVRSGGLRGDGDERIPLGFGFRARLPRGADLVPDAHAFADAHALLFEGELWAVARGKRIALAEGPIMLIAQRMVSAVEALVDAYQAGRPLNVRLRSGDFAVGMRLDRSGEVALTLGPADRPAFTLPALSPASAGLPVLRLATDLIRAVTSVDRSQTRNLRLRELRAHVRRLRHALRSGVTPESFQNQDPDRLRLADGPETGSGGDLRPVPAAAPHRLRFSERWAVEIDGLEAHSTFSCGDRIVVATPNRVLAVSRDQGELLWLQPAERAASVMVGTVLLRMGEQGLVELWDVRDGQIFAQTRIAPRAGIPPHAIFAGGGSLPPLAIIQEQPDRLVAIDLRTGETRWRFRARSRSRLRIQRSGRVLVAVSSEGGVDALDVATGEVVWRYAERARLDRALAVCRDVVVLSTHGSHTGGAALVGVDLYSGAPLWRRALPAAVAADPVVADGLIVVAVAGLDQGRLLAFQASDGQPVWQSVDPGMLDGGSAMVIDRALVINAPTGQISAVHLLDGQLLWQRALSNSISDDVPRQLEPVLRNGALFVPSAQVHVLRPNDGASLAATGACDLVPDLLRVDERGWLYVAEESGHLRAYAPAAHLQLVR